MMFTQFLKALSLLSLLLAPFTIGQNTSECEFNKRRTLSIGIVRRAPPVPLLQNLKPLRLTFFFKVMFDGFEPIEVWGQLEYLTSVSLTALVQAALTTDSIQSCRRSTK